MNFRRFIRKLKYIFGTRDFIYRDNPPNGHIHIDGIPDIIFDRDIMLYNSGINVELNVYRVLAKPLPTTLQ